jgi:tetratricopeptide (TPR) repeat protein
LPINFFHPVFGLSGFEPDSTLRVWDLLQVPRETDGAWNAARSGRSSLPDFQGIALVQPPSLADVFGGAEKEIAAQPPEDLPPAPNEPKTGLPARSGRNLRRTFARVVSEMTRRMPHTASQRTWINDVEDWANRQLRNVGQQLDKLRHREVLRLLHLLETDPENGLRHAIRMSDFAHRGKAPPSAQLGSHSLDFDPRQLGGRPADFWDIAADLQANLQRQYRELANREMQLGRYRRAAYIFAELLGDLQSAANVLKQGRLFREAALLYEEHLRNPLEAARCLAEGGLLAEAIERYEKLKRWLDAADLYERMDNHAAAEAAVRRVVRERLDQGDILGAAQLLDSRLHALDESLSLLVSAWPASRQAINCLSEAFNLWARAGRHDAALERLAHLTREELPSDRTTSLLALLGRLSRDYPDSRIQGRAADFSRVLVSRQFTRHSPSPDEAASLIGYLVLLAPRDRLLPRDGNRFLADLRSLQLRERRVTPPPPLPANQPIVVGRIDLPRQINWLCLRREWHWFYALGTTGKHLTAVRGIWEGECQSLSWKCPEAGKKDLEFTFAPTGERGLGLALSLPYGPVLETKRFPASDLFFGQDCRVGLPAWMPSHVQKVAFGEESVWTLIATVLGCFDREGRLQRTIDICRDLNEGTELGEGSKICLAATRNGAAIAWGNRLILTEEGGLTRVQLPGQAIELVPTLPYTRQGLAIMMDTGASMYWHGSPELVELTRDLHRPTGAFIPGGPLVLTSAKTMRLLEMDARGVHRASTVELSTQQAVGVCATTRAGQFAVLGVNGQLTIYRMPQ